MTYKSIGSLQCLVLLIGARVHEERGILVGGAEKNVNFVPTTTRNVRNRSIPRTAVGVMLHMVCVRVNRGGLNGTKLNDIIREVDCTIERVV